MVGTLMRRNGHLQYKILIFFESFFLLLFWWQYEVYTGSVVAYCQSSVLIHNFVDDVEFSVIFCSFLVHVSFLCQKNKK